MGSGDDYCAFTKAVENLGDRWSLLIVGNLERLGPQGFNALMACVPGISRSMLVDRLRKLEQLGLVARDPAARNGVPGYCVTPAGAQLKPVFVALKSWALRWVPEDPVLAERDPDLITWWLTNRVDTAALPARQVVIDLDIRGSRAKRAWLVLEPMVGPSICIEDPNLAEDRYVYVEAEAAAIYPVARGLRSWTEAISDGSVQAIRRAGPRPRPARLVPWRRAASAIRRGRGRCVMPQQVERVRAAVSPNVRLGTIMIGAGCCG